MPSVEPLSSGPFAPSANPHGLVVALSAAGLIFILLGFLALALPPSQEGVHVWQIDALHAIYLMDVAGVFALGMGLALAWLSGKLWNHHLMS